jgi:hypothetical protein
MLPRFMACLQQKYGEQKGWDVSCFGFTRLLDSVDVLALFARS